MRRRNNKHNGNRESLKAAQMVDDLAEFQKFRDIILPALRADLENGLSAEAIYEKNTLIIRRVVPEGKKEMDYKDFERSLK